LPSRLCSISAEAGLPFERFDAPPQIENEDVALLQLAQQLLHRRVRHRPWLLR
jgi:hypothetical protein